MNTPIRRLRPSAILSFGAEGEGLDLLPLNVLIGPNGSGKSNFIEVLNFLRAAPGDWRDVVRRGGGVAEWIWKGAGPGGEASVEAVIDNPAGDRPLRHAVSFRVESQAFHLETECVEDIPSGGAGGVGAAHYRCLNGVAVINRSDTELRVPRESLAPGLSILAQRREPDLYPALATLASAYDGIRIYREWAFGRSAVFREPQRADQRNDRLAEDFSNLGLFLNRIKTRHPTARRQIVEHLSNLYHGIADFDVLVEGGTVQLYFTEGDHSIPASRLSDGTLRYLCLLAILCDPEPPGVVCIEEPELGLHPDLIPRLGDLLVESSQRMQLVVTTHSDILVDALSERPESVVVCERTERGSSLSRLDPSALHEWLGRYRLGQLWMKGEIGGTRW